METANTKKITKSKKFVIDYACDRCQIRKTNHNLRKFVCRCGGSFRCIDSSLLSPVIFDSYFDPTIGKYLTSFREQEREGKKFVTREHPKGLTLVNDNKKFMNEMRYIRKHKEDYIKAQYAKEGKDPKANVVRGTKYSFSV